MLSFLRVKLLLFLGKVWRQIKCDNNSDLIAIKEDGFWLVGGDSHATCLVWKHLPRFSSDVYLFYFFPNI